MVEECRQRSWTSLVRFCVCLNLLWTFVESGEEVACSMPRWGITYMGSRNITKTGKACQAWATNSPHPIKPEIKDNQFPDESKEEAKNFCRNPDPTSKLGVWCYTIESNVEWEYCDVCPGNYDHYSGCVLSDKGENYRGKLDHSMSYMECEPWSSHENSEYKFPERSAANAKSYCRNPDPKTYEAPWCFIKGMPGQAWDYCDICKPFQGEIKVQLDAATGNRYEVAYMSNLACIRWCITWLTCLAVVTRSAEYGRTCMYVSLFNGPQEKSNRWKQYNVQRICHAKANGRTAYFVNVPRLISGSGPQMAKGTVAECDNACIEKPQCAVYDRSDTDGDCYIHGNLADPPFTQDGMTARYIIRCNPSLKPLVDLSAVADFREEAPSPEPLMDGTTVADLAGMTNESLASTEAPKKEGLPIILLAVGAVVLLAAIGGGVFAYYILVYKKGKKASQGGDSNSEKQRLMAKK